MKRLALLCAALFVAVFWRSLLALVFFGYWPQSYVERLKHPIEVHGWDANGLRLADGRTVQLPGFRKLPARSEALANSLKGGVEIESNGRVIGLVQIWHTCGNDSLWTDIRRVDLDHLLEFMREGEFNRQLSARAYGPMKPGGAFRENCGWADMEFLYYRGFLKGKLKPQVVAEKVRSE